MAGRKESVIVLGAGIQGCCTALELARRGYAVTLLERDTLAMNRASLRNEGKIHLGLVYANEPDMETARIQLQGALSFRMLLAQWIGDAVNHLDCSTPFHYLVAQNSLLDSIEIEAHYARVQQHYQRILDDDKRLDYLGTTPVQLYQKLSQTQLDNRYNKQRIGAGFATVECSISTERLAIALRKAITANSCIQFCNNYFVESVERVANGFQINGHNAHGSWKLQSEQVVNATWENRLAIDHTLGIDNHEGLLHRLKYRVIAQTPERFRDTPSATIVLGPYGDVVIRPDDTVYLSWYPLAMRGWSHDLHAPEIWNDVCQGHVPAELHDMLSRAIIEELDQWIPGVAKAKVQTVDAGVIVAYGKTDVNDINSGLHNRTRIGITSQEGYHSLDAGKLTTAPMFACLAADHVSRG